MEELYQQNVKIVYHYLFSLCRDEKLAEDLTQDTFLHAFESIERYDGSCKLSTWLCQIAKHLLYQTWERKKREIPSDFKAEDLSLHPFSPDDPEQKTLTRIELLEVLTQLQKLPQSMREVIYLRTLSDLSYKDIGQILGKSESWARTNFYRGKEILLKMRQDASERRKHE